MICCPHFCQFIQRCRGFSRMWEWIFQEVITHINRYKLYLSQVQCFSNDWRIFLHALASRLRMIQNGFATYPPNLFKVTVIFWIHVLNSCSDRAWIVQDISIKEIVIAIINAISTAALTLLQMNPTTMISTTTEKALNSCYGKCL